MNDFNLLVWLESSKNDDHDTQSVKDSTKIISVLFFTLGTLVAFDWRENVVPGATSHFKFYLKGNAEMADRGPDTQYVVDGEENEWGRSTSFLKTQD